MSGSKGIFPANSAIIVQLCRSAVGYVAINIFLTVSKLTRQDGAESFDPDRYDDPRHEEKRHRFQDVPFGGGAHKCIGMSFGTAEVKSLLHQVLLRYRLEVPANYEVEWDHTSLVVPTDGMPVTLRKIS